MSFNLAPSFSVTFASEILTLRETGGARAAPAPTTAPGGRVLPELQKILVPCTRIPELRDCAREQRLPMGSPRENPGRRSPCASVFEKWWRLQVPEEWTGAAADREGWLSGAPHHL